MCSAADDKHQYQRYFIEHLCDIHVSVKLQIYGLKEIPELLTIFTGIKLENAHDIIK